MKGTYERIETLCKNGGITVTELCRECKIPRATLSDFKTGRVKTLSAAVLSKIAAFFSVRVDFLLDGESKPIEDELKVALFGGEGEVTDAMWDEVKRYAMYIKERENADKKTL